MINIKEQNMLVRQQYEAVMKMTGLELAKIETDEMHPLYDAACAEIDARAQNPVLHAIDTLDEVDAWDRSFQDMQERSDYSLTSDRLAHEEASHRSWLRTDPEYNDEFDSPFARDFQETDDLPYWPA
jgi:hypothetical protein